MRLINTESIKLQSFDPTNIPEYAIFSHVWGSEEISYQDMLNIHTQKDKQGFSKIKAVCEKATLDGMKYVWVDTCCINKESSAEISEAINSMYQWYQEAQVCYVYLVDVPSAEDPTIMFSAFSRSKWFSRGWTLQELIAPSSVIFYGTDWTEIGTKASLQPTILLITGIESAVILSNHSVDICAAQIMSWAASRQTTKEEDIAYCLMGFFGVHMPIVYGEGRNAFIRLQQEIIRVSDDQTIFAWKSTGGEERGPLASSPAEFCDAHNVVRKDYDGKHSRYSMTNNGLFIELPISRVLGKKDVFLASLGCAYRDDDDQNIAIYLRKEKGERYIRINSSQLKSLHFGNTKPSTLFIKEQDPPKLGVDQRMPPPSHYTFLVRPGILEESGFVISKVYPSEFWTRIGAEGVLTFKSSGASMIFMFRAATAHENVFAILLGIHNYSVWSDIVTDFGNESAEDIHNSYYDGKRSSKLWENRDRSSAQIQGGKRILLSIRRAIISGKSQYLAEMNARDSMVSTPESSLQTIRWTRPRVKYMFWVTISPSISTRNFFVSETLPTTGDPYWMKKDDRHFLCLDRSGSSGIIMFENVNTKEKFAVMVGIHNYRVWSDIVTNFGDESANSIRESYYAESERSDVLWFQRSISTQSMQEGRFAKVHVRSTNDADFMTDITLEYHDPQK